MSRRGKTSHMAYANHICADKSVCMRNQYRVGTIELPHGNQTPTVLTLTDYRLHRLTFVSAVCVSLHTHFEVVGWCEGAG